MKKNKITKIYGILGKTLCGCAGAAIGFVTGGIGLALLGILPGIFVGHLFERSVIGIL